MVFNFIKKILGFTSSPNYQLLIEKGAMIIDVRSASEFDSGSVPGAVNIPVENISKNIAKINDKKIPIITICASGIRSGIAKSILKSNGYEEVYNAGSWYSLLQKLSK